MNLRRFILLSCILLGIFLYAKGVLTLNNINDYYYNIYMQKFGLNKNIKSENENETEIKRIENTENRAGGTKADYEIVKKSEIIDAEPVNLLLLGLDKDRTRSDVIMLINFNPAKGKLNILSIARDTKVLLNGKPVKINSLIGTGGEEAVSRTVSEITGLPIHYYATLDFEGFKKIIDTLGGVEYEVPFDMDYDDPEQNLHIHLSSGLQVLDGDKAEQFVRYRKGYTDADIGRIKAQQDFLKALINQKLKLRYLSKIDDIFYVLKDYMKTNIELKDINYYLKYINKVQNIEVNTYILPGEAEFSNNIWYYIYNPNETSDLIKSYFSR